MFNKEGIPFFIIIVPFLSILFISFFSISYYLKLSNESYQKEIVLYKKLEIKDFDLIVKTKLNEKEQEEKEFIKFMLTTAIVILFFMALFTYLMFSIIKNIIKKYKYKVQNREDELKALNENLFIKIEKGIQEAKQKDKKILEQAKLARIGSMISMIAHQWRQPLSQLSAILMELETATRFKKVNDEYILNAVNKSDKMIEFMSNTIDDFRNFYKPDKIKEDFLVSDACKNAINIISNAKDILIEKEIENPKIQIDIKSKGILSIITIKDNAGGIKEENTELLFDPYYSTKDSSKGTGLGLYISKLIIERNMGGELSVFNDNEGAVFKIVVTG